MKNDQSGLLDAYSLGPNLYYKFFCGSYGDNLVSFAKLVLDVFTSLRVGYVWTKSEQENSLNMWICDDPFQNPLFKLCSIVPYSKEKHVQIWAAFNFS